MLQVTLRERRALIESRGGDPARIREYETVAAELWHVCMPGYFHSDNELDLDAYLEMAIGVVDRGVAPWGDERVLAELRGFLEGAGVVGCGIPEHARGEIPVGAR